MNKRRQYFRFQFLLIADEIIVHNKKATAPALLIQGIQLQDELFFAFSSRHMPVQYDDIAELTVIGTSPGIL